jgi:uncharacterized protein (DUF486 family)
MVGRLLPVLMLVVSNIFMTYAWYGHLKDFKHRPLIIAIAASWGIALFEYCLQVPANRIGFGTYSLCQLKVVQEIIAMGVFAVFAVAYMNEKLSSNFLWASLCLVAAAFFIFRDVQPTP